MCLVLTLHIGLNVFVLFVIFVCFVVYNSHSLLSLPPIVFSLLRCILSLGYSVMPSQQSKPSNSQRNFVFAKIRRLNKAIVTAFQEKDNGFDLNRHNVL